MEDKELLARRAKNAVISRDFNLAIRLYTNLLQDDEKNIIYLNELGNLYMKANDDSKALVCFQKILSFSPDNFEAMNAMGGIYRRMGKYQESIDILQNALKTKINPAQVYYNLGFTYKLMEKYDEAVNCFENVISANPTDVLAYNHLGTIYAAQNNHEKAVAEYKRGLQVDPNHPILQFNMAKSLESLNDDMSAIQAYETALRARPGWQDAVIAYSDLLLGHRKTKAAGELVQNSIALHPKDAGLYVQMGKILMRQSNFDKAASSFEIANRLVSGNAETLKSLAEAFEKTGKKEEAVSAIKNAEKLEPENNEIKKSAASVYLSANKISDAGNIIRELGRKNSRDCELLDLAGQYCILSGKDEMAERYASKINSVDSNYDAYLYSFASRYFQKGNYEKAKEKVKSFIDDNMKNVPAWILLGQVDELLGNSNEALDDFSTAVAFDPNNYLAGKLAKEIGRKVDAEVEKNNAGNEMSEKSASFEDSQEISLDEFGFDDEESGADNADSSSGTSKMNETEKSDNSEEKFSQEGLSEENNTDIFAIDNETPLFEDSSELGTEDDSLEEDENQENEEESNENAQDKVENSEDFSSIDDSEDSENKNAAVISDNAEDSGNIEKSEDSAENSERAEESGNSGNSECAESSEDSENSISSESSGTPGNTQNLDDLLGGDSDVENSTSEVENTATESGANGSDVSISVNGDFSGENKSEEAEKSEKSEEAEDSEIAENPENTVSSENNVADTNPEMEAEQETSSTAEQAYDSLVGQVSEILPKITSLIENPSEVEKFKKELDLFKRLRELGESLPFEQRARFLAGRVRILLDYIIARLSGKAGLLTTAVQIREECNLPVDNIKEAMNGANRKDIINVLKDMESLTSYLEDKNLSKALIIAAEEVVDKLD